jgi:pectate lyase
MGVALALLPPGLGCVPQGAKAFPGAQGFGSLSIGGRGGRVIEVTNLHDVDAATGAAVPGSLRAAIEATGPRTVVFRVSGIIDVCERNQALVIRDPYITIAGQTAPGDGITLRVDPSCSHSALSIQEHDVVIRHIRFRPGSSPDADLGASDALSIAGENAHDVIIDHCSFSWATDENVDISWGARDVTVQYSIVSEALKEAPRRVGPSGGYGMLIAEGNPGHSTQNISIQRNLFAHNWYRNPQVSVNGVVDYRNNVLFNWGLHGVRVQDFDGPTEMNIVGNYAKAGPLASSTSREREMWALHSLSEPAFSYFVQNNIGPRRPSDGYPEAEIVFCREHYDDVPNTGQDCDPADYATPTPFWTLAVSTLSPSAAYDDVLRNAGATLPRRDAVDARVVADARNGTGTNRGVAHPAEVGGWPAMASTAAPADGDHDGMPDAWENLFGLKRADASDGRLDPDRDGYTNVEEFLNGTSPVAANP